MSWARRFRLREYLRGSLWFVPLIAAGVGPPLALICVALEPSVTLPEQLQYSAQTASTVLTAIVGAMVALTGFVVTLGVLIVQMATGMLSPRFMRLWYRDPLQKGVLGVFLGTLTFAFTLLGAVEDDAVPDLGVAVAGALVSASLVLFLLYLDRFIHRLRPVEIAALVGRAGARAFSATVSPSATGVSPGSAAGAPSTVACSNAAGAIQAVDEHGLLASATRHRCVLVLRHPVGDFVTHATPLVEVRGALPDPDRLRGMVALGRERTLQQDPAFALRIMVDIALIALSPAVNAPTTAVQVLNHIEDLLQTIGEREFDAIKVLHDGEGVARVVLPARSWGASLERGGAEIRTYGAAAPAVTRRRRAVLPSLSESVRPGHRPAVAAQLGALEAALERAVPDAPSRAFAWQADRQGIGGAGDDVAAIR